MKYTGSHTLFPLQDVSTYPLKMRKNKVSTQSSADLEQLKHGPVNCLPDPWFKSGMKEPGPDQSAGLQELAETIVDCYKQHKPVIVLSGAHPIKNGLNPILVDLIKRGIISCYVTNGAGVIHSLELALTGESSESVRDSLPKGEFGMAFETGAYINYSLKLGRKLGIGFGESMGSFFTDRSFRSKVLDMVLTDTPGKDQYYNPEEGFPYIDECIMAAGYDMDIPVCICSSMGTDIIDQHASFDGETKGRASGIDFLIFAQEITKLTQGGVILNIGTAIMGPEVLLKAVSMATNIGKKPDKLIAADFDIRPFVFDDAIRDENSYYYYLRDQKSVATRIPKVFGGAGYYFQGQHEKTIPPLYQYILKELGEKNDS